MPGWLGLVQLSQGVIARERSGQQGGIGDDLIRKTWMSDRPMMGPRLTEDLMIITQGTGTADQRPFPGAMQCQPHAKARCYFSVKCAGGTCLLGRTCSQYLHIQGITSYH